MAGGVGDQNVISPLGKSAYKTFIVIGVHEVEDKPLDSMKPWQQDLPEKTV